MLIDTHAHLWFEDFKDDLDEVLARAKATGVEKIIVPGTDIDSSKKSIELAKSYPGVIYAAVGVHPEEANNQSPNTNNQTNLNDQMRKIIKESRGWVVAIGEIGTDQYNKLTSQQINEQRELFKMQCEIALEYDLPIIVHTRNSLAEALEVLDSLPKMPRGQFHCFSNDEEGVTQVLSRGFHISFCGNITWSKRVAKLVAMVRDERLLLETDSPFMKPRLAPPFALESYGGVKNEPANVAILAEKIAELRGQTVEQIAELTTANAIRLFRL